MSRYRDIMEVHRKEQMPNLSQFYGIIIKMFFEGAEHNPPHIHVFYAEYEAEIDIRTGEIIVGKLPVRAHRLVREWVKLHHDELSQVWNSQKFKKIKPLE